MAAPPLPLLPSATSSSAAGGGCRPSGTVPRRLFSGGAERAVATCSPPASSGRARPRLGAAVCRAAAPTSCGGGGTAGLSCVRAGPCRGVCRIIPPAAARRRAVVAAAVRAPATAERRAGVLPRSAAEVLPAAAAARAAVSTACSLTTATAAVETSAVCSSSPLLRAGVRVAAAAGAAGRQPRPGGGTVGIGGAGRRRRGRRWRGRSQGRRRWEVAGRPSRGCVTTPAELTSTPRPPQIVAPACAGWPAPAPPPLCGRGGSPTTPHGARVADRASLTGGGLPPRQWRHHPRRRAAR